MRSFLKNPSKQRQYNIFYGNRYIACNYSNENKLNIKPAVIKRVDNTIGLPAEFLDDTILLTHHKRTEIPSEDVSAITQEELEDNTISQESRSLSKGRTQRTNGIATTKSKGKSFPHGYDKI